MNDDDARDLQRLTKRLRKALGKQTGKIRVADMISLAGFDHGTFQRERLIATAMRDLGWTRSRLRFHGKLGYAYTRGSKLERETILDVERGTDGQPVVKRSAP